MLPILGHVDLEYCRLVSVFQHSPSIQYNVQSKIYDNSLLPTKAIRLKLSLKEVRKKDKKVCVAKRERLHLYKFIVLVRINGCHPTIAL